MPLRNAKIAYTPAQTQHARAHAHAHAHARARTNECCQVFYKAKMAAQMQRRGSIKGRRSSLDGTSMLATEAEKAAQQENASMSLQLAAAEHGVAHYKVASLPDF